ncbi:MAG: TraB/GumN family protein [Candidatus Azobacteroides sp.]|nr:TraB/GumN family protein [Candidatus Azobacteroides sp.]
MKKSVVLFLLIIATCSVYAQTETYKSGAVLWKISGKDLSEPSYLLGTFHLKSGEYLDSIPGAIAALQSCEQVVGEVNMSDMAGLQMQMIQVMKMTPDTTYKMLYSDEDYRFVSEKLASLIGSGLEQLGMLKPAAIQLTVIARAYMKYYPNINPANILDIRIQSEAIKEQKPVLGLETINDQIHVLFGIKNLQQQADALLCSMKNLDELMSLVPEIINDYERGNLNKLYERLRDTEICPSMSSEEETDALNKERNNAWMEKLPEIMKEKSSFIAVGALHLAGEDGLLNLLEKAGYSVEPVNM